MSSKCDPNLDWLLIDASKMGNLEWVKSLIDRGADVQGGSNYPLRNASEFGHLKVVKYLVSKGAYIHAFDDELLYWSAHNGHTEVVKFLESVILKEKRLECLKSI